MYFARKKASNRKRSTLPKKERICKNISIKERVDKAMSLVLRVVVVIVVVQGKKERERIKESRRR